MPTSTLDLTARTLLSVVLEAVQMMSCIPVLSVPLASCSVNVGDTMKMGLAKGSLSKNSPKRRILSPVAVIESFRLMKRVVPAGIDA